MAQAKIPRLPRKIETLCGKVMQILATGSTGFFGISLEVRNRAMHIFYKKEGGLDSFFDIDFKTKELIFYESPKSFYTEQACIDIVSYLEKQDYSIVRADFVEKPRFKKNEISLC